MRNEILLLVAAALAVPAGAARADAPMVEGYFFEQPQAGTVTIAVQSYTSRSCPDDGLLRRDVATGEVLAITACSGTAFVDECVPAGTYEYGLATPLACHYPAGTEYYATVTVTTGAAEGCTRATAPPPATATSVPWPADQEWVCEGHHPVLEGGDGGCATGGAVLGTNLVVLAAGLALWRRRRPRG